MSYLTKIKDCALALYDKYLKEPTMSITDEPALKDDDAVLNYTQAKREFIVKEVLKDGKLPEDPDTRTFLLKALDGMDKAALGKKRIKVEEKQNANQEQAASLIAQMLIKIPGNYGQHDPSGITKPAPTLSPSIPDPVLVPGEISVTAPQMSIDMFHTKTDPTQGAATSHE